MTNTSGTVLPVTIPPMTNTSGTMLPLTIPPMTNTSGTVLSGTIPLTCLASTTREPPANCTEISSAGCWTGSCLSTESPSKHQSILPLPAALHSFSQPASDTSPHSATVPITVARTYQPLAEIIPFLQAALAICAAAPTQPRLSSLHLTPLNSTIPTIHPKFNTAAAAGELLHQCIEVEGGPCVYRWENLALPRKPKKKATSTFSESVSYFAYQPHRGCDMLAWVLVCDNISTPVVPFGCSMAYDVTFRKKAGYFRLSPWGHKDPQVHSKTFTGASKA